MGKFLKFITQLTKVKFEEKNRCFPFILEMNNLKIILFTLEQEKLMIFVFWMVVSITL